VSVRIDESGRDNQSAGINLPLGMLAGALPDKDDTIGRNPHICRDRGCARSVYDGSVTDKNIEILSE